ncbi:hypothetical protein IscW_ISCW021077, partial [Ixodes scapularis]
NTVTAAPVGEFPPTATFAVNPETHPSMPQRVRRRQDIRGNKQKRRTFYRYKTTTAKKQTHPAAGSRRRRRVRLASAAC